MTRDDSGMSLIELLIAITVLGVIIGALGGGLIVAFRFSGETKNRLATSHDAQITAAYFAGDMASAEDLETGPSVLLACGAVVPAPSLSLAWTDPGTHASDTGDDTEISVSYVVLEESGETRLIRRLCREGTVDSTTVMAHLVDPAHLPAVTCAPSPCGSSSTSASMTVTACVLDAGGSCRTDEEPYEFTVSGTRRATS